MTTKIHALVPAMLLAFGAATALAHPAASPFAQSDQPSLVVHSVSLRPFDQGNAVTRDAAYISDGSNPAYLRNQNALINEPGYSIGTGAARISDGSDPSYLGQQRTLALEPGFSVGTGAARISDGSDPSYLGHQGTLDLEPGYSVGTGAARVSGAW